MPYEELVITCAEIRRDEWMVKVLDRRTDFSARVTRRTTAAAPPFEDMVDEVMNLMGEERARWMKAVS